MLQIPKHARIKRRNKQQLYCNHRCIAVIHSRDILPCMLTHCPCYWDTQSLVDLIELSLLLSCCFCCHKNVFCATSPLADMCFPAKSQMRFMSLLFMCNEEPKGKHWQYWYVQANHTTPKNIFASRTCRKCCLFFWVDLNLTIVPSHPSTVNRLMCSRTWRQQSACQVYRLEDQFRA